MKKSLLWLTLLLCLTVIGAKGGCQGNADKSSPPSSPVLSGLLHAPAGGVTQAEYFAKLGLGGNYGPHYNAFDSYVLVEQLIPTIPTPRIAKWRPACLWIFSR